MKTPTKVPQTNNIEEFTQWRKEYLATIEANYYEAYIKGVRYNIVKRKRYLRQVVENWVNKKAKIDGVNKLDIYLKL